jgi:glutamate-1-semialdehyde 2,1-aminomutase
VETQLSIDVARRLTEMIPCAERVRFSNSGTEAIMHAVQIARGFTGRQRILKTEGNYHGWYDYVYCSHRYPESEWQTPTAVPSSQGLSSDVARSTLAVPWNDLTAMEDVLRSHGHDIAAILLEPVDHNIGCALPRPGYLQGVRRLSQENGVVLIFDEVITGFRAAPGGAQQHFEVTPDLATFAKAVANGYPLSVVAGQAKIMDVVAPERHQVSYGGTYNGSQVALAAAAATLDKLKTGEVQRHLRTLTESLVSTFNEDAKRLHVNVRLQGFGGKFQVYFTSDEVVDWRSASRVDQAMYREFQAHMVRNGVLWVTSPFSHNALTWAHTAEEVDTILALGREFLARRAQRE